MSKRNSGLILPPTNDGIVKSLINDYGYKIKEIAKHVGVSRRKIYRILREEKVSSRVEVELFRLYCISFYRSQKASKKRNNLL